MEETKGFTPGHGPAGDETPGELLPAKGGTSWAENALARLEDPVAGLHPAAQRVVLGAMRVLVSKGFSRLTLAEISAASGENVAAVKYYFGNKAGLVDVLLRTVVYNELKLLTRPRRRANSGLSNLTQDIRVLSTPDRSDRILMELVPLALRDRKLREHLRQYYKTFFELHLEQLATGASVDPDMRARMAGFAMILSAVADGLTIQAMVGSPHFDLDVALQALDALMKGGLPTSAGADSA